MKSPADPWEVAGYSSELYIVLPEDFAVTPESLTILNKKKFDNADSLAVLHF